MFYGMLIQHCNWCNNEIAHVVTQSAERRNEIIHSALQCGDEIKLHGFANEKEAYTFAYDFSPEEWERILGKDGFCPAYAAYPYIDGEQVIHLAKHLGIDFNESLKELIFLYLEGSNHPSDFTFDELNQMYIDIKNDYFLSLNLVSSMCSIKTERDALAKRINQIAAGAIAAAGPGFYPFNDEAQALLKRTGFYCEEV